MVMQSAYISDVNRFFFVISVALFSAFVYMHYHRYICSWVSDGSVFGS